MASDLRLIRGNLEIFIGIVGAVPFSGGYTSQNVSLARSNARSLAL